MNLMFRSTFFRLSVLVAGFALAFSCLHAGAQDNQRRGRKYKVPPPSARIEVSVVRDFNGKPIESAAVIFHPIEGDRDEGVLELKTNFDGKAIIDVIPIGDTVRLQIIAKGFKTYGQDFKIDKDSMAFEIRMKRPGEQYSIYKAKDETAESSGDKPATSSRDAAPADDAKTSAPNKQATPSQTQPETN
jgi:hypothetical protein